MTAQSIAYALRQRRPVIGATGDARTDAFNFYGPNGAITVGAATPAGFVPIFQGWNVWSVWAADDPKEGVLGTIWTLGESNERKLQVWIEDRIKDGALGAAVADPANPAALRGDQIQIIPSSGTLSTDPAQNPNRPAGEVPKLGDTDKPTTLKFVRFFNRGNSAVMPWPADQNYELAAVYDPSASNPITDAVAPSSLGGALTSVGSGLETTIKYAGIGLGAYLLLQLFRGK